VISLLERADSDVSSVAAAKGCKVAAGVTASKANFTRRCSPVSGHQTQPNSLSQTAFTIEFHQVLFGVKPKALMKHFRIPHEEAVNFLPHPPARAATAEHSYAVVTALSNMIHISLVLLPIIP